jgi:methionyl-tRNA formyltransferase
MNLKILFMGRDNCEYTARALELFESLEIEYVVHLSSNRNEDLPLNIRGFRGDYLLSFNNYIIVPDSLLKAIKKASINFHPSPPEYRGSGGSSWAIYNQEQEFCVTAHLMNQFVDSGAIFDLVRFKIQEKENWLSLKKRALDYSFQQLERTLIGICEQGYSYIQKNLDSFHSTTWSGPIRKIHEIDDMQVLTCNASEEQISRTIRAFHSQSHPVKLRISGRTFVLETLPN